MIVLDQILAEHQLKQMLASYNLLTLYGLVDFQSLNVDIFCMLWNGYYTICIIKPRTKTQVDAIKLILQPTNQPLERRLERQRGFLTRHTQWEIIGWRSINVVRGIVRALSFGYFIKARLTST